MFSRLTIRVKILTVLAASTVLSVGLTSLIGYFMARQSLERESFKTLTAVRELKASQVEDYFLQITDQVVTFSEDRMIVDAMKAFKTAFQSMKSEPTLNQDRRVDFDRQLRLYYQEEFLSRLNPNLAREAFLSAYWPFDSRTRFLQYLYIAANPFKTGSKQLLDDAMPAGLYGSAHKFYHPIIRNFLERFGYYDIFLVDHETGHIVYTVFKEVDFGTSLLSGPYRETNFARAFRAARDAEAKDFVHLEDFETYHPSYNAEASFIASPIFDGTEKVGVLLFQMPVDRINDIMTSKQEWDRVGLGTTGETYIVGDDFRIRNQSRFLIEDKQGYLDALRRAGTNQKIIERIAKLDSSIGMQEVKTEGSVAALGGETGTRISRDYRNISVLSAFRPLDISGVNWAIMSEIDESEAFEAIITLRNGMLVGLVLLFLGAVLIAVIFSRSLTRPLKALSERAADLAKGSLEVEIDTRGHDEIAELAQSFDTMRRSIQELVNRQAAAIDALATPLIPVHDEVVVAPLVGHLDDQRVDRFRETLVEGLHSSEARVAIIDVTGVPQLDDTVAAGLVRAAMSARLLGTQVIITGMRPEVARDLAETDLRLEGLITERSLARGIEVALHHVGQEC
jgi:methyl-accepting chemotaxis protein